MPYLHSLVCKEEMCIAICARRDSINFVSKSWRNSQAINYVLYGGDPMKNTEGYIDK